MYALEPSDTLSLSSAAVEGATSPTASRPRATPPAGGAWRAFAAAARDPFGAPPPLPQRRVVVTGVGIVCPVGVGARRAWDALLDGATGTRALTPDDLPEVRPAAYVGALRDRPRRSVVSLALAAGAWVRRCPACSQGCCARLGMRPRPPPRLRVHPAPPPRPSGAPLMRCPAASLRRCRRASWRPAATTPAAARGATPASSSSHCVPRQRCAFESPGRAQRGRGGQ